MSPRYLLVFQMLAADRRAMYDFPQITKITLIGERYETVTHCTAAQTGKGAIPGEYTEHITPILWKTDFKLEKLRNHLKNMKFPFLRDCVSDT